jgi:hypothetical protein
MSNTNFKHFILDYWDPSGLTGTFYLNNITLRLKNLIKIIVAPRKTKMLTIALMENNKFRLLTELPGTSPSLHEDFDDFGTLMRMLKTESMIILN